MSSDFTLGRVPNEIQFTDKILCIPTLNELGLTRDLAGLPIPKTLGVLGENMPGSFTESTKDPASCWISRGDPIFNYKVAVATVNRKSGLFRNKTEVSLRWDVVQIQSPISGMIVGYRVSDDVTFYNGGDFEQSPTRKRGWMYPIILVPKNEPRPTAFGFRSLIECLRRNAHDLMIQVGRQTRELPHEWIQMRDTKGDAQQLSTDIESAKSVDEVAALKARRLDASRDKTVLDWIEYMRGLDRRLAEKLKHITSDLGGVNWLD